VEAVLEAKVDRKSSRTRTTHALLVCARCALLVTTLSIGAVPVYAATAGSRPVAGSIHRQAAQPAGVDCDLLPDTSEGPIVVVTAPTPGTTLAPGTLTIQGAAFDCAAEIGAGVDRVSVFLGRRDAGGLHLGEATLSGPNPIRVLPADQYSSVGWTLTAAVPLQPGQASELYVYAHSDVNGRETAIALPVTSRGTAESTATPSPALATPVPTPVQDNAIPVGNNIPVVQPGAPVPDEEGAPATMEAAPESDPAPIAPTDEAQVE
jgi:hypothetical protein